MKKPPSFAVVLIGAGAPAIAVSIHAFGAGTPPPVPPPLPTRLPTAPGTPPLTAVGAKPGEGRAALGMNPPANADGNFLIGPDYVSAPELNVIAGVPQGQVRQFLMDSKGGEFHSPGIARHVFGTVDPNNPKTLIVETHSIDYQRTVTVYIPSQYVPGTAAPFLIMHDGPPMGRPDLTLPHILDNLIAQRRVPAMIAIMLAHGGGDAQGSERGREYDTMSGRYAEFIEADVLPLVEKNYRVTLTRDPEGRATMGSSSGGSAALSMAWYHSEWYHRVITYSGTFVNQQWPFNPKTPCHARRHARLGRGQQSHGRRAQGEGLPLPVRLCPQFGPRRSQREKPNAAARVGVGVAGLSHSTVAVTSWARAVASVPPPGPAGLRD